MRLTSLLLSHSVALHGHHFKDMSLTAKLLSETDDQLAEDDRPFQVYFRRSQPGMSFSIGSTRQLDCVWTFALRRIAANGQGRMQCIYLLSFKVILSCTRTPGP